jgi:formylglycine-generating enzyme required for sulfatase activity
VFISYSHADRDWVERLKRMMAPLLRGSSLELRLWDDSQIEAGSKWREVIETALAQAKVALLLVSDHFLASEFVMGEEVPRLLAAAEAEGVRVLWVSLSACLVEETEIHQYQAVLPPGRPLDQMAEAEVKEALKTIGLEIRKALKPQQEAVAPPSFVEKSASPGRQEGSGQAPQINRAETPRPPAPTPASEPPQAGALQAFSVTTARLLRVVAGWQVERRETEMRGRTLELGDGVSLPLIAIPAGEFVMGSPLFDEPERQDNEEPQHRVQLEGFLMGQTPITQAQWRLVARLVPPLGQRWQRELPLNPSKFSGQPYSDQRPVEKVIWQQAIEFCRRLSALTGDAYTLPSEAQWEYACRAGSTTPFAFGETISPELANYDANYTYANGPKGEYRQQTTPAGSFPANAWGLQDMHGNVLEWCLDHWHGSYEGAPIDGSAWLNKSADASDMSRLLRGGSWYGYPGCCRSAYRDRYRPDLASSSVGFRVVCLPQGPSLNP